MNYDVYFLDGSSITVFAESIDEAYSAAYDEVGGIEIDHVEPA